MQVDISSVQSPHNIRHQLRRALWNVIWALLFRLSPRKLHGWRRFLLRLFGARIGQGAHPYPSARIWAPWNLTMGDYSCLADRVDCYSVAPISIGKHSTVSQYSYLCAATHDYTDPHMALVASPISIGAGAWIAADVFIGPGVSIGDGAVVGARSSVFSNIPGWTVVGGNPARVLKVRQLSETIRRAS